MRTRFGLAWLGLLILISSSHAQTTAFTYQGKLIDNGTPATGNYDLQFKLFNLLSGGTQQGTTQTVSNVAVVNGIFTVQLDFGACDSCFNGAPRFLDISVRPTGGGVFTPLLPRQPVASTPYAIKTQSLKFNGSYDDAAGATFTASNSFAGDSAGLNTTPDPNPINTVGKLNAFFGAGAGKANVGGDSNSFFGAQAGQLNLGGSGNSFYGNQAGFNNNSGIDNTFVGRIAGYNNQSNYNTFIGVGADFDSTNLSGVGNTLLGAFTHATSGITNGTAIGLNTTVTQSNSLVLGHNANVGIGTTAPGFKLEVIDALNAGLHVENNTAGGTVARFGRFGNFLVDSAVNGGRMTVLENGNVGIGATSPSFKLHLIDSSNTGLRVQTNTAGGTVASFGGVGEFHIDSNGVAGGRFTALESGFVGIGTNNPQQKFHVSGTGVIRALVDSDSNAGFGLALSNQQKWSVATVTGGNFQIYNETLGSNAVWIDSTTSNVGVGTTTPDARLTVDGGSDRGLVVSTNNSGTFVAQFGAIGSFAIDSLTNGAGRFLVDNSNTVWINTPPSGVPANNLTDTLIVNGAIRANFPLGPSTNALCFSTGGGAGISHSIVQCASSIRYKTNVNTFTSGLNLIRRLRPVSFNWKQGGTKDFGLIAEEVAEVEPLLATYDEKGDVQGVKYDRVGVVLINAVKEQQAQITAQQTQLKQQTEQIQSLRRVVDQQQHQLAALNRRLGSTHRKSRIHK